MIATDPARVPWPDTVGGRFARAYLGPLMREGIASSITNVHAELGVVTAGRVVLPFTLAGHEPDNSYVCSPFTHYISYGREEIHKLGNGTLIAPIDLCMAGLGWGLKSLDNVVLINNWLLSTNLYPALSEAEVLSVHRQLLDAYPRRALVWRSVDAHQNPGVRDALEGLGYRFVFSRQVWYQQPADPRVRAKKQFKRDLKWWRRSPYRVVDGEGCDYTRVAWLYNKLYVEKYSAFNPQFSAGFLERMHREGLWTVKGLVTPEGRLDAVLGYYTRNGVMTAPLCGYDTDLPREFGLYRMIGALTSAEAVEHGLLINDSAGVGAFKKHRGSVGVLEHNAVFDRHLPLRQRAGWALLRCVLDGVGVPLIQRYDL